MSKINIYFSPLYIISTFITLYFGGINLFCNYFLALSIHESSHYFMAKRLGYMLNNLSFMPYGAKLQGNTNYKKNSHEIMVGLSGPLSNLFLLIILISCWWINPISYYYTYDFALANFFIGIFNLIPLVPLDGGQVFLSLFKKINIKKRIYKCMQVLSILISLIFVIMFLNSFKSEINFSLLFISLFLIVSASIPFNTLYFNKIENLNFKVNSFVENKTYFVNVDTNILKLVKLFNSNYVIDFKFVDKDFKLVKILNQNDILKLINQGLYYIK